VSASKSAIASDLRPFRLTAEDIDARTLSVSDHEILKFNRPINGYKIPYYDINGLPVKHSRIRHISDNDNGDGLEGINGFIRTSQETARVYFPIGFQETLEIGPHYEASDGRNQRVLFITDDERAATSIVKKHQHSAVAIEGPAGWQLFNEVAGGFIDLVETCIEDDLCIMLWIGDGKDKNIQREVANLAMELKFRGLPFKSIRQYREEKFDADFIRRDFEPRSYFPRHPNIRSYLQEKIGDNARLSRRDHIEIGLAMLSDMEALGIRIQSETDGNYYYFNHDTNELMRATINVSSRDILTNSEFMKWINNRYGIYMGDSAILKTFATQFMSEEPIYQTRSHKVIKGTPRGENTFHLQLTASDFVFIPEKINRKDDYELARVTTNGTGGVLFERDAIEPVDLELFQHHLEEQRSKKQLDFWWGNVVDEVRMDAIDEQRTILALLFYISPWLLGWKRIQLPIEVVVGEAGSGKSSLFVLRLSIMTGRPDLKNLTGSLKDWQASVVNNHGLMVMDNVHLTSKSLRQGLSDEMCRLVTEPQPTIEARQLYTTADVARFPIACTFGITSIENVFTNVDFIQRAVVTQLDKSVGPANANFDWANLKLNEFGGREAWMAHHVVAVERFFRAADKYWDDSYRSRSRLINFEQSIITMARVFGLDVSWMPKVLQGISDRNIVELDWVLEGLRAFALERLENGRMTFKAAEICDWASGHDDFMDNYVLTNPRRVGRYITSHKTAVLSTTGIERRQTGKTTVYRINYTYLE